MVKLPQIGTIKKEVPKEIAGVEGGFIEFYEEPSSKLVLELQGMKLDPPEAGAIVKMVIGMVVSWNFTDDNGKEYPINRQTIEGMKLKLLNWIGDETAKLFNKAISPKKP